MPAMLANAPTASTKSMDGWMDVLLVSAAVDAQLMGKESERLSAAMRAEKAETSAVAAQNELLEVTKRCANIST